MDKIIIVFYVGIKGMSISDIQISFEDIKKQTDNLIDKEDIIFFILPDYDLQQGNIKADCINPKYVNKSVYNLIDERLKKIETEIKSKLKENEFFD